MTTDGAHPQESAPNPPIPVRHTALRRWLISSAADSAEPVRIEIGHPQPLPGGMVSQQVSSLEITAFRADGTSTRHRVVAKRTEPGEAAAIRRAGAVPDAVAFPELIDAGSDADGPWLLQPHYPGSTLTDAQLPTPVYDSLARLHIRHLGQTADLPTEVVRVDAYFIRSTLAGFASDLVRAADRARLDPVHSRALTLLQQWSDDERMRAAPHILQSTVLHGDPHSGNLIIPPDGANGTPPRLIDWGNSRVGPMMLDVVMSAPPDTPGFAAYLHAWRRITGSPLDRWEVEAGSAWAVAFINAMFCGLSSQRFGPSAAAEMLDVAERALNRLEQLLAEH
jgi:aminoglycoside phosphotransferase (APT) family kinase protein